MCSLVQINWKVQQKKKKITKEYKDVQVNVHWSRVEVYTVVANLWKVLRTVRAVTVYQIIYSMW